MSARQVARTASLLLDKRLKVETLVPDSLGLSLGSSVGERKSGGERGGGGVGAHILSAMFPDDDSEGDGRILDQVGCWFVWSCPAVLACALSCSVEACK